MLTSSFLFLENQGFLHIVKTSCSSAALLHRPQFSKTSEKGANPQVLQPKNSERFELRPIACLIHSPVLGHFFIMFYSQFILAKKGPLATIWIAAHLERKLRKNQITDTNIGESVDSILYPEVPIALRLSGHLLLGVVRIYSRKVNLLFNDCSEALVKIHQAFQSSAVDLPPGAVVAPFNSITLPESFDFDDLDAHFKRENVAAQIGNRNDFEHHVTERDLITLQEQNDDRRSLFSLDERFEDVGNPYAVLDLALEELAPEKPLRASVTEAERMPVENDVLPPLPMEDEMDVDGMNIDKDVSNTPSAIEPHVERVAKGVSPFPETTMEVQDVEKLRAASDPSRQEHLMGLQEFDLHWENSVLMDVDDQVPSTQKASELGTAQNLKETPLLRADPTPLQPIRFSPIRTPVAFSEEHDILGSILGKRTPKLEVAPTPVSTKRAGKKRKHAFDAIVSLSSADMKKQLKSTSDICRARQRAPSTEYEVWMSKRDNHIEQTFIEPSFPGLCEELKNIYEGVINKRVISQEKPPTADQLSLRRTPRRLDPDAREKLVDSRKVSTEPTAEEAEIDNIALNEPSVADELEVDIVAPNMPSVEDELIQNVRDVDTTTAQPEEPRSPDHELAFVPGQAMDDGALDVAREQDEGVFNKEQDEGISNDKHLDGSAVKDIRVNEDEAATNLDNHYEIGGPKSQGLGFLADSRDADEAGSELGRSSSNDSGWSSRSRAVAMYLKEKFEAMEPVEKSAEKDQSRHVNLEKLLTGRTRREAARLFFETLVLGTKGYLQVEQARPYADVQLTATRRLLKAAF